MTTTTEFAANVDVNKLGTIIETGEIDPRILKVADTNNRTMPISDKEKFELRTSIGNIGVLEPVLLDEDNGIVSGQLRWAGAIAADRAKVPFIRMKFKDKFSARIASIVQDYLNHPLTDKDRYLFVKKAIDEDRKTLKEIADSLGIEEQTIRAWAKYEDVPAIISNDKALKQSFLDLPIKKKIATESILNRDPYKNDTGKAIEFIEFARNAPLRELEQVRKDVIKRTPVNAAARKQRLSENTTMLELRIPKYLDTSFRNTLRELNMDYVEVIIKLIENFVRTKQCPTV